VNGTPGALDRIRKGTQDLSEKILTARPGSPSTKSSPTSKGKPFAEKGQTKPILITKDNVDDPNLWGNSFR